MTVRIYISPFSTVKGRQMVHADITFRVLPPSDGGDAGDEDAEDGGEVVSDEADDAGEDGEDDDDDAGEDGEDVDEEEDETPISS